MKETVVIVKSSSWKLWKLSLNHPEYAAILKLIKDNSSKFRFVLVGSTQAETEALKLGGDILAWDLHRTGGVFGQISYFLGLFMVLVKSKPSKVIALGLLNLFPISMYSLLTRKTRFVPFFIGEFGYFGQNKIGKILHSLNFRLLAVFLTLSSSKISNSFTLSNFTRKLIEQLSPSLKGRIQIISYPISNIFLTRTNAKSYYLPSTGEPIVLCVAGIEPRKGLDVLIRSFSLVSAKAKLVIKGSVRDSSYLSLLNHLIGELKLNDKVTINTQAIEYDKLVDLYRSSAIFVFPTLDDCLGIVVLEALHSNLPVIASNVGGVPEMIKDGVNGHLVPPRDATKLAEAIMVFLSNPKLIKHMSECSLDTLKKMYYDNRLSLMDALDLSLKS